MRGVTASPRVHPVTLRKGSPRLVKAATEEVANAVPERFVLVGCI
jgi:hypothetical protein